LPPSSLHKWIHRSTSHTHSRAAQCLMRRAARAQHIALPRSFPSPYVRTPGGSDALEDNQFPSDATQITRLSSSAHLPQPFAFTQRHPTPSRHPPSCGTRPAAHSLISVELCPPPLWRHHVGEAIQCLRREPTLAARPAINRAGTIALLLEHGEERLVHGRSLGCFSQVGSLGLSNHAGCLGTQTGTD